jgi:hypothetical protein
MQPESSDIAVLLKSTLPPEALATWLPPVSELAKVDCRASSAELTIGEALAMALTLLPKGPDLDLVALSAPGRLPAAINHHATVAVIAALLQHTRPAP